MYRMTPVRFLAVFLIAAWAATGAARAQNCPPLQLLDQIPLVPVNDASSMLVPVTINGVDKFMVFDTGASVSAVTHALAREQQLEVYPSLRTGALYDAYGNVSRDATMVRNFRLGHQDISFIRFNIWPNPELDGGDTRLAGLLSLDLLQKYDVDADFAGHVLKLFSPDHCDGKILYWKSDAVTVAPLDNRDGHINIVATLDGKEIHAIIDSGAPDSVLSGDAARHLFGLTDDTPGLILSASLSKSAQVSVYQYRFQELDFGGLAVKNPLIALWPDTSTRHADKSMQNTGNRAAPMRLGPHPNRLIIGMDILSKLHMYIASREHRIYFSSAASPDGK